MKTYLIGLIALALLGSEPLFGQAPAAAPCGPTTYNTCGATTCGPATCNATTCNATTCNATTCNATTCNACDTANCNGCGNGCGHGCGCGCKKCCPSCGCCLVPVCHVYCAPKTITHHEYTCRCEDVCIPGPSCCCCKGCNQCDGCCGHCCVRQVPRLVIHPVTEEVPVRKCTVQWVCPKCGACCGQCESTATPPTAPVVSNTIPLAPLP